MLIVYVVVALFAVVLTAVVVSRARSRSARPGRASRPAAGAKPAAAAPVGAGAESPPAADWKLDVDEDATQVYMRSSQASGSAAPRSRDGAAPVAPTGARLVGLTGSHKGQNFAIAAGITVGRKPPCDIVIADTRVSSRHAWIGIVDGKAVLRDLKSTNGTFLNAQTSASVTEVELRSGDTIFFGGHQGNQFRFVAD